MLQFSQFVWALRSSVCDVFNNFLLITQQIEVGLVAIKMRFFIALSLYPLSFFANNPFKYDFKWNQPYLSRGLNTSRG